ncbi:5,6-dimethylbenzimidazole synthase [Pseudoroseomonas globiformis]|uniref:5,6-dimethylbenzimidazole synthase n=1 Tax=Teichococcus globiformis TaxID=2307229 RepID=A0ABV7FZT2_9PROT
MTIATFDAAFRDGLAALLHARRDVRHFRPDPVPEARLHALLNLANLAPSVGLSQPWRFVLVEDPARRAALRENFLRVNATALAGQGEERAGLYARLKLEGMDQAPCQFALFALPDPEQGHGLGRGTMPETTAYSAVMALHTIWLAARAEGLGLGWVSILEPEAARVALDVPAEWRFIGYFCLGYPEAWHDTPELQREGWEHRRPATLLHR